MAYDATSQANWPQLVRQTMNGKRHWRYESTDAAATVDDSGYFTNGYDLGMRDGDTIEVYETDTKILTMHVVTVSGTTVNLADGTTVGSATNTN